MAKLLWHPSQHRIEAAEITRFIRFINQIHDLGISGYTDLYRWSIENIPEFWDAMYRFSNIIASEPYQQVVDDLERFPGTRWFPGAKLNFAENLLRYKDERLAFIFESESGKKATITYAELNREVARLAASLRSLGVKAGDVVCAYMPNLIQTPLAMLAASSIGALWASCGAELGPSAVLDRFGQIDPRVLFTVDGYDYRGKVFETLPHVKQIVDGIETLRKVIVAPYISNKPNINSIPNAVLWEDFISTEPNPANRFEQLPFDHPLYIMFSSGTTGKPKCMVQGAGGILLNHLKELMLSTDLKREDRIVYITAPSWMMWNWLMSSLAVGATIVLYEGNPLYPDWGTMFQLIQDHKITIFGTSASYIHYLMSQGADPGNRYDLSSLKEISQTASTLSPEGFEYCYRAIKQDLHLNSISGGTDINGCFAGGTPNLPVYSGQLQGPSLGMKIKAYDETGQPVVDQQAELVCEAPSPSMPLYFWDDPDMKKYRAAYFDHFQPLGKNVWRHGDYIEIDSDTGGITFWGRSDAVLMPSGVRLGTAEIYNVIEALPEIADSLAIGQKYKGDIRIVLFVQMAEGQRLTDELKERIRTSLRRKASPRHVPDMVLETPDIPYTFSNKKVEIAVSRIMEGKEVTNQGALRNPQSLQFYQKIRDELKSS